ncbi:MAG: Stp1/IreP family PP2C-type Ser/Thr phosphatase [Betaproteobacteria bacterium]|nr:Stp1/IreP family PP2C-type Ser/Thr phosphatase [Betaproteobacteria bacterium]MBI3056541.1 Stp1/IreP family PP2C-type Ser/Thr phosphatase [Betaproteobacteria bacterium]
MKILVHGLTDKGLSRKNNEDSFFADKDLGLIIVADGMGGHSAGEVASRMAVEALSGYIRKSCTGVEPLIGPHDSGRSDASNRLVSGIRLANQVVCEAAKNNPSWQGMGTTIVAALADGDRLSIAHVGDSRAYLVRSGTISQLTDDHSVVAEYVRKGLMSKEEAEGSRIRNLVTRALGLDEALEVDVTEINIMDGDRLLLCSDGLSEMVADNQALMIIASNDLPESVCTKLVNEANNNGGMDNITVVAAFVLKGKSDCTH